MRIGLKNRLVVGMICMLIVGVLTTGLTSGALAEEKKEPLLFGASIRSLYLDFFVGLNQGVIDEAEKQRLQLMAVSAELDPTRQLDQIDSMITLGVDAVILNPQDPRAIIPGVKKLNEAGIPVVTLDTKSLGGDVALHISTDNTIAGRKAGENMVKFLEEKYGKPQGLVLEMWGDPRHVVASQRSEGFHNVIDNYPEIEVIQKVGHWVEDEAFTITTDMLTRYGDKLSAIYTHNDGMALGAVVAIAQAGYEYPKGDPKHVIIASIDGFPDALKMVREGKIDSISVQPAYAYGTLAVQWAMKTLKGEKVPAVGTIITQPGELWSPAVVHQIETGPALLVNCPVVPTEVKADDPRLWGNRL